MYHVYNTELYFYVYVCVFNPICFLTPIPCFLTAIHMLWKMSTSMVMSISTSMYVCTYVSIIGQHMYNTGIYSFLMVAWYSTVWIKIALLFPLKKYFLIHYLIKRLIKRFSEILLFETLNMCADVFSLHVEWFLQNTLSGVELMVHVKKKYSTWT